MSAFRTDMKHGEISMYTQRKCRCALCRACMAQYSRDRYASAKAKPTRPVAHGSISTAHLRDWA